MTIYDNTIGAAYVGGLFTAGLFGITCTQAFNYYQTSKKDPNVLKFFVAFVLLCDAVHMVLVAQGLYWYMVSHFTDGSIILDVAPFILGGICVSTISDTAVRLFFTRRIWILSHKSYLLITPLFILIVFIFITGISLAIRGVASPTYQEWESVLWLVYVGMGMVVAGDLYIAVSLCILLYRARSGVQKTNSIVHTLMVYAINTGLLTGIVSTLSLVASISLPTSYVWVGTYFPLCKLYCNAMLATLNARDSFRSAAPGSVAYLPRSASLVEHQDKESIMRPFANDQMAAPPQEESAGFTGYPEARLGDKDTKASRFPRLEVHIERVVRVDSGVSTPVCESIGLRKMSC